jgi:hypothetical protein
MLARTHFFGRYGHIIVVIAVGIFALLGISQGDIAFPLLSAALLSAIALSVHATERMMFLESKEEWLKAEHREIELHRQVSSLTAQVSEV